MPPNRRKEKGVGQSRTADAHERARGFLADTEVGRLPAAEKRRCHGVRNHLLLLLMFRHGLRVSGAIALCRSDANLDQARLLVARLKNGLSVEQPLAGDELRAFRRWLAMRDDILSWLFVSERPQPLTRQAVHYIVAQAGKRAGLGQIHPPVLRRSCRFALANKGHDLRLIQNFPGHRDPRHTAHCALTAAGRFEGPW